MALRKIVQEPSEFLRKISRPVEKIDQRLLDLLDDMAETMIHNEGLGIAAVQVGVLKRVVVIRPREEAPLIELINPVMVDSSGEQVQNEGCLSVPGRRGTVRRPKKVRVRAQDRFGKEQLYEATGYLAVAFCHELDHLDGVLFTDKALELENE